MSDFSNLDKSLDAAYAELEASGHFDNLRQKQAVFLGNSKTSIEDLPQPLPDHIKMANKDNGT